MSLSAGTRRGPYEVGAPLGAGGMGEVYRARDPKLGRDVAIKVLPSHLAEHPEALARFGREAKAVAALSHPNILAIFDFGEHQGRAYAVMELLECETLRERLDGGALPPRKAAEIAQQMAQGLAAAHDKGVIHRDLKPENVFLTRDGVVKLLDFGLARQMDVLGGAETIAPTQTHHTQLGTILGTIGYMSPEQVRGAAADHRSDIFSFGAVLYEMVSARRAFQRETAAETMTAILREEPTDLGSLVSAPVDDLERLVRHCLEKRPEERFQSARDLAFNLASLTRGSFASGPGVARSGVDAEKPLRQRRALRLTVAVAAIVILAATAIGSYLMRRLQLAEQPVRSELLTEDPLTPALFGTVALSPDGTRLLTLVGASGKPSIAIRDLAPGETRKLPGTEGATFPFWAPDSQEIAFFAGGKLKRIGVNGGSVQVVGDAKQGRGGSWGPNGIILFAPDIGSPILEISESGGSPVPVTRLSTPSEVHRNPMFLPDGKRFLFSVRGEVADALYAGSIDGNLRQLIVENASKAAFARGRLFFVRDGNLVSQPFDPVKLELSGALTAVAGQIEYFKVRGIGNFSVVDSKMVYVSEPSAASEIVIHDRNGRRREIPAGAGNYRVLDIAPDDRLLAVAIDEHFEQGDVWLVQLEGGTKSRFSFVDGGALSGAFSPDGASFAMSSGFFGQAIAVVVRSLASNDTRKLLDTRGACIITGWSHDGKYLVVDTQNPKTGFDVQKIDVATGAMTPVVHGPGDEVAPAVSPNGKWLAYVSTESGTPEVYLTAFPSGEGKWQATQDGGGVPRWSRDGRQLFYVKDDRLMALDFHDGGALPQFGSATTTFVNVASDRIFVSSYAPYAVTSDGGFVTTQAVGQSQPTIHLVTNWHTIVGR